MNLGSIFLASTSLLIINCDKDITDIPLSQSESRVRLNLRHLLGIDNDGSTVVANTFPAIASIIVDNGWDKS